MKFLSEMGNVILIPITTCFLSPQLNEHQAVFLDSSGLSYNSIPLWDPTA